VMCVCDVCDVCDDDDDDDDDEMCVMEEEYVYPGMEHNQLFEAT